jgi:hypothetical protein
MPKHALMAGAVLLFGCAGSESPVTPTEAGAPDLAISAERVNYSEQVTILLPNFCTGELVVLSGRVHVNTKTVLAKRDAFRFTSHVTFDLRGYGLDTGDLYHLKDNNTLVSHLKGDGKGETFTQIARTRLHRKGTPTKAIFEIRTHFVEHADGTRSVDRTESSFEC